MAKSTFSEETKSLIEQLKSISPDDACTVSCWDTYHFEVGLCREGDESCRNRALDKLRACCLDCGSGLEAEKKVKAAELVEKIINSLS